MQDSQKNGVDCLQGLPSIWHHHRYAGVSGTIITVAHLSSYYLISYLVSGCLICGLNVQKVIYVTVMEGGEENPLLDSRFPDVSAKGRGYQLHSYPEGIEGWPELRRVTIWQTVAALEQEFRDRAARLAEAKKHVDASPSTADYGNNAASEATPEEENISDEKIGDIARKITRVRDRPGFEDRRDESAAPNVFDEDYDIAEGKCLSPRGTASPQPSSKKGERGSVSRAASTPEFGASVKGEDGPVSGSVASAKGVDDAAVHSSAKGGPDSESPSRFSVARPHHIPKMESLSKKLDQIRMEMGEEVSPCLSSYQLLRRA